jgi:hypothetical protein
MESTLSEIEFCKCRNLEGIPTDEIGVYALKDFDQVVLYTGQTWEGFRTRIRCHFTRSDILAKHQIDPGEIAFVEYWTVDTTEQVKGKALEQWLIILESHIFHQFNSQFPLVNTDVPALFDGTILKVPESKCVQILPDDVIARLSSPEVWKESKKAQLARMNWYRLNCNYTSRLDRSYNAIKERYIQIAAKTFCG